MATKIRHDETGLDSLDLDAAGLRDAAHVRGIITAMNRVDEAAAELDDAVRKARAAGDSWTVIGMALGVSRQAAQKRFGSSSRAR